MNSRQAARQRLGSLASSAEDVLIIHYSCESFKDKEDGYSPRISAIAVRNHLSGQTYSYSIHLEAEARSVSRDIVADHYDDLECAMLSAFFRFASQHKSSVFVHWNMRDVCFGFEALYHRFRVLKGTPTFIDESRQVNLAKALKDIYGPDYVADPRLERLIDRNAINKRGFLNGAEEAKAFSEKEYFRLHQSTLRKVEAISSILQRYLDGKLVTEVHPVGAAINNLKDNWIIEGLRLVLVVWGIIAIGLRILGI